MLQSSAYAGRGTRLLVGVSGGPDSTALLASLVELRASCEIAVHVAHVDHGLRDEARSDAAYVRRLCARWTVPVMVRRVDVSEMRRAERLSVEEAARKARHTAFLDIATSIHADAIALGHTADDHTETVLLHLLRGSGLRGLAGMAEQSESAFRLPDTSDGPGERFPILRPLRYVTRDDVMRYLHERRLRPRQDMSNWSPEHVRNRVRHELLPLMEAIRPGAGAAIGRASSDARQALDYLESQVPAVWQKTCEIGDDDQSIRIDRGVMRGEHAALRHGVLERAVVTLLGSAEGLTRRNYLDIDGLIVQGRTGSEIVLPRGLRLLCVSADEAVLAIGELHPPIARVARADLCHDGETVAGEWTFASHDVECGVHLRASGAGADLLPGPMAVCVAEAGGMRQLRVRTRVVGDRIQLPSGARKVQDVFVDGKIPRVWRDRIPIVCDAETGGILWMTGVAVAAGVSAIGEDSMTTGTIEA